MKKIKTYNNYNDYPNILKEPMEPIKKGTSVEDYKIYYANQTAKKLKALYDFYGLDSLDANDSISLVVNLAYEFIPGFSFKSNNVGAPNIWNDESFSLDFYMRVKSKKWDIEHKTNSKCSIANAIKYVRKDLNIELSPRTLENVYSYIKKLKHIETMEEVITNIIEKSSKVVTENPYKDLLEKNIKNVEHLYKQLKSRTK